MSVNPMATHIPRSEPLSPMFFDNGPVYHTWCILMIAPTHPTKKATSAAMPIGKFFLSSQIVQSKPILRPFRNIRCSSSTMQT